MTHRPNLKGEIEKMMAGGKKACDGKYGGMNRAMEEAKKELASWFDTPATVTPRYWKGF